MKIGVPTEIKVHEYRVGLTPAGVKELTLAGHQVSVQKGAGLGSAFSDDEYVEAGATIVATATEVWKSAELLIKVKEPIAAEYDLMQKHQVLFTFLHLAASKECTDALIRAGVTSIAYETVTDREGTLPLLAPMSEVAGRLATQVGADSLLKANGGRGVLLAGIPGVLAGKVVVIGGGVAGTNAAKIAVGMGAQVTILDRNLARLRQLDVEFGNQVQTLASNEHNLETACMEADLVIGAVLIPGAKAPKLVSNQLVSKMKPGAVLVDIAIDQGGCFEDSRPTTHSDPTYAVHDTIFYCVANMPGAVPRTSTFGLTNATLPYALRLANLGWREALAQDAGLMAGLHTHAGEVYNAEVAHTFGLKLSTLA